MRQTAILLMVLAFLGFAGCEKKEKVLDVETPGMDLEVHETEEGDVEVDLQDKKPRE